MRTEVRFILAIGLMLVVLVGTNLIFPPAVPDEGLQPDSVATQVRPGADAGREPVLPPSVGAVPEEEIEGAEAQPAP